MTIAVLFHRIGPYHFARLRAAGRQIETTAIELSNKDDTYAWDKVSGADSFKRVTLFDEDVRRQPRSEIVRRVHAALDKCQPMAVAVNGWSAPEAMAAYQWCLKHRVPPVVMSESTAWDERRVIWKEWVKGRIVQICSAGFAGGQPHAKYLMQLGMPPKRIALGYDIVDNVYFQTHSDEARARGTELRRSLGLPERYFIASARFVEKKNLSRLLEAYAGYRQQVSAMPARKDAVSTRPWSLLLLGDGPLGSNLKAQVSSLNLIDHVQMPGFKQYPELPIYYGLASAFVHASTSEQWGLVVNEAMAAGLPVLVSNRCGCAEDLVSDGINGFTFDPLNVSQLADLMVRVSHRDSNGSFNHDVLSPMGCAGRKIVSEWGPERFAAGLREAVETAIKSPLRGAGMLDRMLIKALSFK